MYWNREKFNNWPLKNPILNAEIKKIITSYIKQSIVKFLEYLATTTQKGNIWTRMNGIYQNLLSDTLTLTDNQPIVAYIKIVIGIHKK